MKRTVSGVIFVAGFGDWNRHFLVVARAHRRGAGGLGMSIVDHRERRRCHAGGHMAGRSQERADDSGRFVRRFEICAGYPQTVT